MSSDHQNDIVIVGGGLSGLQAAAQLGEAGFSTLVLEARERLGGRLYTVHDCRIPVPIELGAEFIHELSPELMRIIRRGNIAIADVWGEDWVLKGEKFSRRDIFETVSQALSSLELRGDDVPFTELYDGHGINSQITMNFIEGFNAAPANQISAKVLLSSHADVAGNGGYQSFRVIGGYDSVVRTMVDDLPSKVTVRTRAEVRRISWQRGEAKIGYLVNGTTEAHAAGARAVILTVPLGVLQMEPDADGIEFMPDISETREAARRLQMGDVVRISVLMKGDAGKPQFLRWRPELSHMSFVVSPDLPFRTWWTSYPFRVPLLTAWSGGPAAGQLLMLSERGQLEVIIQCLQKLFQRSKSEIEDAIEAYWTHNWTRDSFSRGAYSFVPAGASLAVDQLRKPLEGTLFFAGEATEGGGVGGTVESALRSGNRAAAEVIEALGGSGNRRSHRLGATPRGESSEMRL